MSSDLNSPEAIDRDVWIPFMAAYPALDAELALSTCSTDYIHAGGPEATAQGRDSHLADFRSFFDMVRGNGDRIDLEFRFTQRILGDGVAHERGLFRMDVEPAEGEPRQRFGYFQVFLRVENGRWRILTDYDEPGGTAEAFEAATPLAT
jgi:ketosteroid isomerase-like protein